MRRKLFHVETVDSCYFWVMQEKGWQKVTKNMIKSASDPSILAEDIPHDKRITYECIDKPVTYACRTVCFNHRHQMVCKLSNGKTMITSEVLKIENWP